MGRTYASLNSSQASDTTTAATTDFLDSLWRAQQPLDPTTPKPVEQIRAELARGIRALDNLLTDVDNPIQALVFVNNLLQAATQVEGLKTSIRNAKFLRELVEFGFEFAKTNPTATATTSNDEALSAFLNTLWLGGDDRLSQGGLSAFFDGLNTLEEQVKVLDFADRLIDAAQLVSSLGTQARDAKFLSHLVGLGSAYVELKPVAGAGNFSFLDFLWNGQTEQETATVLNNFLEVVVSPDIVLKRSQKLLKSLSAVEDSELQVLKQDPKFLSNIIDAGKAYTAFTATTKNLSYSYGSPPSTKKSDPLALIPIRKFIDLVKVVERAYPNDTTEEITTRIRRLYYPGRDGGLAPLKFDQLLPNARNYDYDLAISGQLGAARIPIDRVVRRTDLERIDGNAYSLLTAQGDENGIADNPSPYIILPGSHQAIDVGHLLLTLDALLHPGSGVPYTTYNVPTIDPASWVADVGIASAWLTLQQRGTPDPVAPQNLKLLECCDVMGEKYNTEQVTSN